MSSHTVDYSVSLAIIGCNFALLSMVWKRRLQFSIPLFIAYVLFETIQSVLFLILLSLTFVTHVIPRPWYDSIYFVLLFLEYVLQLGVLYQLFHELFRPHKVLPDRAFQVFLFGCIALLVASGLVAMAQPEHLDNQLFSIFIDIYRSFSLLQCVGYFFVVAFASALGLPRRHPIVGIALGMGTSNLGALATAAILTRFGEGYEFIKYLPDLVYICAAIIWIEYFRHSESQRQAIHPQMLSSLQKLKRFIDSIFSSAVSQP